MKWIGAIILILISTIIGFEFSSKFNKRPEQIQQLKNALNILEAEILYSQTKLKDAFYIISKQIPMPTQELFQLAYQKLSSNEADLFTLWNDSINKYIQKSALTKKEKEILLQFGVTLGQYDVSQQQKYITVTIQHLNRILDEAERKRDKYGNMSKTLGILSGIFIVILLI